MCGEVDSGLIVFHLLHEFFILTKVATKIGNSGISHVFALSSSCPKWDICTSGFRAKTEEQSDTRVKSLRLELLSGRK